MRDSFILLKNRFKFNPRKNENEPITYYQCLYCKTEFSELDRARTHVESHELILLPIAKSDLDRLNKFIYLKDEKLLTPQLMDIIKRYARRGALN